MVENSTGINILTSGIMLITAFCLWVYIESQNSRKAYNKAVSDAELRYVDNYITTYRNPDLPR